MKFKLFSLLFLFSITLLVTAQKSNFNGLSVVTGNIQPEGANFGINLQNELLVMREFDKDAYYDVLYEMKNTTNEYGNITFTLPVLHLLHSIS